MTFHDSGPPPTEKGPPHPTTPSNDVSRRSISQSDSHVNPPSAQNDSCESERARYTRLGYAEYLGDYHHSDIVHTDPCEWLQSYEFPRGFEGRLDLIGDGDE